MRVYAAAMLTKSFASFRGRGVRHLGAAVLCVVLLGSPQAGFAASAGRQDAGAFGPRLGLTYSATKTESKRDPSATMGTRNPKMGVYSWGVEVTQPIFQGFRLLSTYQKAALQADSDKASLRKAELDMTEQVQTAFLEYLKAGENAACATA